MPPRPGRSSKKHGNDSELRSSRSRRQLFLPSSFLRTSTTSSAARQRHHSHHHHHLANNNNRPPRRAPSSRNDRPYSRRATRCSSISDILNPPDPSPPPPLPPVPVPASSRRGTCQHRADFWSVVVGPACTCAGAAPPAVHECHICGMTFTQVGSRNTHVRVLHHNIRPYECMQPNCGRTFGQRGDLHRHLQSVHLGQRQHACAECGAKFSRKSALGRHVRAKHNNSNSNS